MTATYSRQQKTYTPHSNGSQPHTIDPAEFCELAVSSRRLIRQDDQHAGLRGLQDLESGEQFWVSESRLTAFSLSVES